MICIINNSIQPICGHGIRKGFCPGHRQIFSHYNYTTRFVKCQEHLAIFFASNFEPCACAAIDAVSNFHISWSWKLDGTCQIFKLMEAATFVKFSHHRSCKPTSNFICTRSCNSCLFTRPPIKLKPVKT